MNEIVADDIDPRRLRSRARLLDAATRLLSTGGVEAVTIDAVTSASKVAKTTLYRHFGSATELITATFERLMPQVVAPDPEGTVRERLTELLSRQAGLMNEAPLHLTLLAWVSLGPTDDGSRNTLRAQVLDQYREPFDQLLNSPEARAELGELDVTLALAELLGPLIFGVMTGIRVIDRSDCEQIVEHFFTARGH